MDESTDFSVEAVDNFLTDLGRKGLMPRATVVARRASCNKVFGALSPGERRDVRTLDMDDVAARFANLEGANYTPDSLAAYKSRTTKSVEDFLRYREDPINFRIKKASGRKILLKKKNGASAGEAEGSAGNNSNTHETHHTQRLTLPIPIRADVVIEIKGVPFDLTKSEAKKIANVIQALASEEE